MKSAHLSRVEAVISRVHLKNKNAIRRDSEDGERY